MEPISGVGWPRPLHGASTRGIPRIADSIQPFVIQKLPHSLGIRPAGRPMPLSRSNSTDRTLALGAIKGSFLYGQVTMEHETTVCQGSRSSTSRSTGVPIFRASSPASIAPSSDPPPPPRTDAPRTADSTRSLFICIFAIVVSFSVPFPEKSNMYSFRLFVMLHRHFISEDPHEVNLLAGTYVSGKRP
jgi:hypothetical protein